MTFGVFGIHWFTWYVTVRIIVPKTMINYTKDLSEKVGIPKIPEFSLPLIANCEPMPTSSPETISLIAEIFFK